jgi:small subunit ribosomal protein S9
MAIKQETGLKTKKESHVKTTHVAKKEKYSEAVGRRKTSVARVRVYHGENKADHFSVNEKPLNVYFPSAKQRQVAASPFEAVAMKNYSVSAMVQGGGVSSQAEAVRLGIARALTLLDKTNRPRLKVLGYLTRDPRMVERKKFGSRKARRPQQWRKR